MHKNNFLFILPAIIFLLISCELFEALADEELSLPSMNYTESWVGSYTGTGDQYRATTGETNKNWSTELHLSAGPENKLYVRFLLRRLTYRTNGVVNSTTRAQLSNQDGNILTSIDMRKNGDRITGTLTRELMETSGNYMLIERIDFNVLKK